MIANRREEGADVEIGPLIRLADVRKLSWLPLRHGKQLSLATVHRWSRKGLRGVKLRTFRAPTLCTTEAWLMEFFEALSTRNSSATVASPGQREKARDRARRELDQAGF